MTEDSAFTAFKQVLEGKQYMDSAKRVSRIMHRSRPRTPLQEAGGDQSTHKRLYAAITSIASTIDTCNACCAAASAICRCDVA